MSSNVLSWPLVTLIFLLIFEFSRQKSCSFFNFRQHLTASNDGSAAENLTMTDVNNATYMTGAGSMFDPALDRKLYGPLTSQHKTDKLASEGGGRFDKYNNLIKKK